MNLTLLGQGMLPDYVLIGAQKCGTSFLYDLLTQHPYVEPATRKEVHYFDIHYSKGIDWYRGHFPQPTWKEGRRFITGEASPYYVFHPHAARRVAEILPNARLIVLLRNPVDRAYSGYHQSVRRGNEPLTTFEAAIEMEGTRLRGEREKMLKDENYFSFRYQKFSYLSRGVYVDQLVTWSRFFGRDQMLVLKSEDLFDQMQDTLERVLDFLGLPRWMPKLFSKALKASDNGYYPPMNTSTRQELHAYFKPYNQRLYEYLGVDFGW